MSLGDLGNNINKAGKDLYAAQRARILREGEEKKRMDERREADKLNRDISNLRRNKMTLEGRIMQLKNDIAREKNPQGKLSKESELKRLINDKVHIEGDLMSAERKDSVASRFRANRPGF